MARWRPLLLTGALLSSCVVGSFDIVSELPGSAGAAAGSNTQGGTSSAGTGGTPSTNGGSDSPKGGSAQGGQVSQGGSVSGGDGAVGNAGEPGVLEGGAGGEAGGPSGTTTRACDRDTTGASPVLCDDFENASFNPQKWTPSPNDMPTSTAGPHGTTNVANLPQKMGTHVENLGIDAAGSAVTVSFWFKITKTVPRQGVLSASLMTFNSAGNLPIFLDAQSNGIVWRTQNGYFAPSKPDTSIEEQTWYCVALYLTNVHMDIRFVRAGTPNQVHTYVIDDMPTPSIDDTWANLPATERGVSGQPSFGSDPTFPSAILIDDVRIARDKSNVCGIQQ